MKKIVFKFISLLSATVLAAALWSGCASTSKKENQKQGTPLVWNAEIKQGVLNNGMTYFVQKNSEPQNRIILRLVVKAGSCMEEDDQRGVAHFIEHLAFNGTENFEKSAIVDYFEKIGMNFGADLNAYTSFEETVYKLEIPADDPSMLENALLILHDWACGVTFPQEEIDKERGVVTEEWRLNQGLQGRIRDAQIPFVLKDSAFEKRLPIGDMDVIANISRDRVLDFYNKWYRPEIMSVVLVGDTEIETMETALKKAMEVIPASENKISVSLNRVPATSDKDILVYKDAEQKYSIMNIMQQEVDFSPRATEEDVKENLIAEIASRVFNQRMDEITNTADALWLGAGVGYSAYTNLTYYDYLGVIPKTGVFTESFKTFLDECDRVITYGATESEVNRLKDYYLSVAEQDYNNREKIPSSNLGDRIIEYIVTGKLVVSEEDFYNLYKRIIPEITVEDVNNTIRSKFAGRGTKLLIIAPESADDIPSEAELMDIWQNHKNEEIAAYVDDVTDDELMVRPSKKGKIVREETISELGANEYVFENGVTVYTKKTDFEANQIKMVVASKGGLFLIDDKDIPSAKAAVNYAILSGVNGMTYNQLIKKITAKQISLGMNIRNTEEGLTGSSKTEDFESLLQLVNMFFTKTQFTDEAWQTLYQNDLETAKNYGVQPNDVFYSKINEILYNDIRHAPFDMDYLSKMDQAAAEKVYNDRYSNPADFTYIFVGDFDEAELLEQCAYYLGSMPTTKEREETVYRYYDFPEGITSATVKKGLDEQGRIFMCFGGKLPKAADVEATYKDDEMMYQLQSLLDIRLREVIREDKSGSYGISVNGFIDGYPERYYMVQISFGCEPSRVEELTQEVIVQIEKLKNEGVSEDYVEKLRETCKRDYETSLRNNDWWLSRIKSELVFTYEPLWVSSDIETVTEWITAENLQEQVNKYFNTENYVSVYLVPEK